MLQEAVTILFPPDFNPFRTAGDRKSGKRWLFPSILYATISNIAAATGKTSRESGETQVRGNNKRML